MSLYFRLDIDVVMMIDLRKIKHSQASRWTSHNMSQYDIVRFCRCKIRLKRSKQLICHITILRYPEFQTMSSLVSQAMRSHQLFNSSTECQLVNTINVKYLLRLVSFASLVWHSSNWKVWEGQKNISWTFRFDIPFNIYLCNKVSD